MSILKKKGSNGNLVLSIPIGDSLLIDENIRIKIKEFVSRNYIRLVINAPNNVRVRRQAFEEKRNEIQRKDSGET